MTLRHLHTLIKSSYLEEKNLSSNRAGIIKLLLSPKPSWHSHPWWHNCLVDKQLVYQTKVCFNFGKTRQQPPPVANTKQCEKLLVGLMTTAVTPEIQLRAEIYGHW